MRKEIAEFKHIKIIEFDKWQPERNCKDVHVNAFFEESRRDQFKVANTYCYTCPVRLECLEYAIAMEEKEGIWGGLPPYLRRLVERKLRRDFADKPLYVDGVLKGILKTIVKEMFEFEGFVKDNGKAPRKGYNRRNY